MKLAFPKLTTTLIALVFFASLEAASLHARVLNTASNTIESAGSNQVSAASGNNNPVNGDNSPALPRSFGPSAIYVEFNSLSLRDVES